MPTSRRAHARFLAAVLCGAGHAGAGQTTSFGSDVVLTGRGGQAFLLADLDGDGALDALTSRRNGFGRDVVDVLRGDGSGGYGPLWTTCPSCGTATAPDRPTAADLDGDGDLDFVLVSGSGHVRTYLNDGGGRFVVGGVAFVVGASGATWGTCADFDGDGATDFVLGNLAGEVALLRGDGAGRLGAALRLPAGLAAHGGVGVDLDGDGRGELALAGRAPRRVVVVALDASGGAAVVAERGLAAEPRRLAAFDVDGDGDLDLCASLDQVGALALIPNEGGQLAAPYALDVGEPAAAVVAADLGGDGTIDLAVAMAEAPLVRILRGAGGGRFEPGGVTRLNAAAHDLAAGDLDGDGDVDLAVVQPVGGALVRLWNRGDGTFSASSADAYPTEDAGEVASVAVADLDGDGLPDLVHPAPARQEVRVRRNGGRRTFGPAVGYPAGQAVVEVTVDDLDGDGRPDLLARGPDAVSVLFGEGFGRLSAPLRLAVGDRPEDVLVGDCDGDGRKDLLVTRFGGATPNSLHALVAWTQPAPRSFDLLPELPMHEGAPLEAALADVDGDGALDVVLREYDFSGVPPHVRVLRGRGDGSFVPAPMARFGYGPTRLATLDLNGDGVAELLLSDARGLTSAAYAGPGVLVEVATTRLDAQLGPLALADVDGDGLPDIVGASYLDHVVTVLRSVGSGRLATARHVGFPAALEDVAVADLDGDGHADLVGAARAPGALLIRYGGAP